MLESPNQWYINDRTWTLYLNFSTHLKSITLNLPKNTTFRTFHIENDLSGFNMHPNAVTNSTDSYDKKSTKTSQRSKVKKLRFFTANLPALHLSEPRTGKLHETSFDGHDGLYILNVVNTTVARSNLQHRKTNLWKRLQKPITLSKICHIVSSKNSNIIIRLCQYQFRSPA